MKRLLLSALLALASISASAQAPIWTKQPISQFDLLTTPLTVPYGGTGAATITGLVLGNGASAFSAYAGSACAANTFSASISGSGALTCSAVPYAATTGVAPAFVSGTQNYFWATPNGSSGVPSLRAIVAADIPTLNQNTSGNAATATALAADPADCAANTFANAINASGTLTCTAVPYAATTGVATSAQGAKADTAVQPSTAPTLTGTNFTSVPAGQLTGTTPSGVAQPSLYGTGADGAIANLTDANSNATTIAQSGTLTATSNRTFRATGNITLSQTTTVSRMTGQARGSFPTTHGSPGIQLGAILSTIGSVGIPLPIKPGGETASLLGGITQFLSGGTVAVNAAINATGTNAATDGGGGGGLVVIVAKTSITGSGAIDVSGSVGGATAAARGGSGSYSGAAGGHAGIGGSVGGQGGPAGPATGAAGSGIIAGNVSETSWQHSGSGGASLDNASAATTDANGGAGAAGNNYLSNYLAYPSILLPGAVRPTAATSAAGGQPGGGTGGAGGINGGGGGGGVGNSSPGGNGGDAQQTNPVGSGGGGGGSGSAGTDGGNGGAGSAGSPYLYVLSDRSIWMGGPGGMGGGGGGGGAYSITGGGANGTGGAAGAGASAPSLTLLGIPSGTGAGIGGVGAAGSAGVNAGPSASGAGGGGGNGGNGGGAAGLVLLIAPTVSYSGTVTGRLVVISGTAALDFIKGYDIQ